MNQSNDLKDYLNNPNLSFPGSSYAKKRKIYKGKEVPLPPIFRGIMPEIPLSKTQPSRKDAKELKRRN